MAAPRASWDHAYEKGLVDIMLDHNNPIYRGQNGWTAEGWTRITNAFNQKFPLAHFTKQQIQEKDKDLKGNYKAVRDSRKQSGTGWDDTLCMIIAEPVIWDKLIKDNLRVKKFRSKPFMLFKSLATLHEGSIASGDLNFVSIPQVDLTSDAISPMDSSSDLQGQGASRRDEPEATTSTNSKQKGALPVKKRKQSQIAVVLEDYMDFRKKQSAKLVDELKESKQDDIFSIGNCVAALEPMEDLSVAEKAKALRLFKCPMNREIFINTKDSNLRLYWLKEEISEM
ncbi:unnamed protein product [Triticum turgidum subsp. durum]|uniref:Myb/SANT-like domain-containing protein n=1 Tax=Triticum turgidum subsp. durum TaxID=4567 RepID=A0A9R1BM21_TRITD|nr:unnamed protein product [Triticum turgidum subsp. durum]